MTTSTRQHVLAAAIVAALALPAALSAQLAPPAGWKWVTDSPATIVAGLDPPAGSWLFGNMAPGWHITTRPGVTLFEPSHTGRGRFTLESEMFLFPGTSGAGFGLFAGGANLEGKASYVAFLVRRDGSAAIESVTAGASTTLHPWTRAAAVAAGSETANVRNVLRIDAEATAVAFLVNGEKVAEVPRDRASFDGVVGLRIGQELNLHVTNLDVTHRLALPRSKK